MNIKELYDGRLTESVQDKVLSGSLLDEDHCKNGDYQVSIDVPEVFEDKFISEFLSMNYLFLTDFDYHDYLLMGEIGGVIMDHPESDDLVCATSCASQEKVMYGLQQVRKARRPENIDRSYDIVRELECDIEMPLEYRDDRTVINGCRNLAHYDFRTIVGKDNPLDILSIDSYLAIKSKGVIILTNKHRKREQYLINIPDNISLFDDLKKIKRDYEENFSEGQIPEKVVYEFYVKKSEILKKHADDIIPDQYVFGFCLNYQKDYLSIRPLICNRDKESVGSIGYELSRIKHIGVSSPTGQLYGIFKNGNFF